MEVTDASVWQRAPETVTINSWYRGGMAVFKCGIVVFGDNGGVTCMTMLSA